LIVIVLKDYTLSWEGM